MSEPMTEDDIGRQLRQICEAHGGMSELYVSYRRRFDFCEFLEKGDQPVDLQRLQWLGETIANVWNDYDLQIARRWFIGALQTRELIRTLFDEMGPLLEKVKTEQEER